MKISAFTFDKTNLEFASRWYVRISLYGNLYSRSFVKIQVAQAINCCHKKRWIQYIQQYKRSLSINANSADTLAALQCFTSTVAVWKRELWLLLTLAWWSWGTMTQYNDSTGPAAGEEINVGGDRFPQEQDRKKCQCVWWLVYVYVQYINVYASKTEGVSGQWGPVHSVPRVGVLGWLRPMVLHNQPAKSTSSTSDLLMNVWLWKKTKRKTIVVFYCLPSLTQKLNKPAIKLSHRYMKMKFRYPPSTSSDLPFQLGFWSNCRHKWHQKGYWQVRL